MERNPAVLRGGVRELSERGWSGRASLRRGCLNKDLKEARE